MICDYLKEKENVTVNIFLLFKDQETNSKCLETTRI